MCMATLQLTVFLCGSMWRGVNQRKYSLFAPNSEQAMKDGEKCITICEQTTHHHARETAWHIRTIILVLHACVLARMKNEKQCSPLWRTFAFVLAQNAKIHNRVPRGLYILIDDHLSRPKI